MTGINGIKDGFSKSYLIPFFLILSLFLWSDALIDSTLTLRLTYISFFLLITFIISFSKKENLFYQGIFSKVKVVWILLLFICFVIASALKAINIEVVIFEIAKWLVFLILIVFLTGQFLIKGNYFFNAIINTITLSSFIFILIGFVELIYYTKWFSIPLEGHVVYATFGNRNLLSEMILLFIPFQFIYIQIVANKRLKRIAIVFVVLSILFVVLAESRSCWIALFVGGLSTLFFSTNSKTFITILKSVKLKWLLLGFVFSFLSFFLILFRVLDRIKQTFDQLYDKIEINSVNERILWWKKSLQMINDNFFLGVGAGNWKIVLPIYDLSGTQADKGWLYFTSPHNDFLSVWSENGYFAFMLYILFFISLLVLLFRIIKRDEFEEIEKKYAGVILFGIIAFIIISLFSFPKDRIEHLTILGVYSAIIISIYYKTKISTNKRSIPYLVVLSLVFCIIVGFKNMEGEYHSKKAEEFRLSKNHVNSISEANKAKNYFYSLTPQGIPTEYFSGIANYELGNYSIAVELFEAGLKANPNHLLSLHFLANSYGFIGNEIEAIKNYEKAILISNKLDIAKINLAISYYNIKEYGKALSKILLINDSEIIKSDFESIKVILRSNNYSINSDANAEQTLLFLKDLGENRLIKNDINQKSP